MDKKPTTQLRILYHLYHSYDTFEMFFGIDNVKNRDSMKNQSQMHLTPKRKGYSHVAKVSKREIDKNR